MCGEQVLITQKGVWKTIVSKVFATYQYVGSILTCISYIFYSSTTICFNQILSKLYHFPETLLLKGGDSVKCSSDVIQAHLFPEVFVGE
jgi:hypothetical protein